VNLIFAAGVERYYIFQGDSPRLLLRKTVGTAAQELSEPEPAGYNELSPVVREIIDLVLERQMLEGEHPGGSASEWLRELTPEARRSATVNAIESIEVEVKKGPSNVIDRLMVRGLAALVHDVTDIVPKRTYRHAGKKGGRDEEAYWFLDLAKRLAVFVNQALPLKLRRPGVAALTGIAAEELDALGGRHRPVPDNLVSTAIAIAPI